MLYISFCRFAVDGANFSINSDGTSVMQTNLSKEFILLKTKIGLNTATLSRSVSVLAHLYIPTYCDITLN